MPHYNGTKSFARLRQEIDEIKKLKEQRYQGLNDKTDEQIFQDVLGKDTHGYLRVYGPGTRKDAENARTKAEQAKKEAEVNRNDVHRKIEQNNAIWKKFHRLMNFIKGGKAHHDE
ncbi:Thymic stromal lymphopoietin, partial [Bienertia sinuspersici]